MKTILNGTIARPTLLVGALLIAALPLTANADPATDRAQALNAEPLASVSHDAVGASQDVANRHIASGSEALAKARLQLLDKQARSTDFAMTEHDLEFARQATTG